MKPSPKCDKCSVLRNGRWTACTCPDGPRRQPVPPQWKRGGT